MTKMKSKKMAKSTFAIIIMGIVMVAMLAFGGTFAYFTATASKVEEKGITTGVVRLQSSRTGDTVTIVKVNAVYNDVVMKGVSISPEDTTVDAWVIVYFDLDVQKAANAEDGTLTAADLFGSSYQAEGWTAVEGKDGYFYQEYKAETASTFKSAFLTELKVTASPDWKQENTKQPKEMGATVTVTVTARSIQKSAVADAAAAQAELFKTV